MLRYDFPCIMSSWDWAACTGCMIENTLDNFVEIKARGLCKRSKFDTSYQVINDERGYLGYIGLRNTRVSFDPVRRHWKMYLVNNPNITAFSNASMESLIMGSLHLVSLYHLYYALCRQSYVESLQ